MNRKERIQWLRKQYYKVCEDPIDGTPFDVAVYDALRKLEHGKVTNYA